MAAAGPQSQAQTQQAIQIELEQVGTVCALPKQLRDKWDNAQSQADRSTSLEAVFAKLEAAEEKRQAHLNQRRKAHKRSRSLGEPVDAEELKSARTRELEDKLATATAARQQNLDERRSKAQTVLERTSQVLDRIAARQQERADRHSASIAAADARREAQVKKAAERLEAQHAQGSSVRAKMQDHWMTAAQALTARMQQAAEARASQLSAAAARAREQVEHAKEVSAAVKAAGESASAAKATALERRLAKAELKRLESLSAVINSLPQAGNDAFLVRKARMRTALLRQASSRKLQRFWRSFCRKRLTTVQLAARFLNTGVPTPAPAPAASPAASVSTHGDVPPAINTARAGSLAAPLPLGYVPVRGDTPANSPTGSPSHSKPAIAVMGPRTGILEGDKIQQGPRDAFERFAAAMSSPKTLAAGQALLSRLAAKREAAITRAPAGATTDITPLLKRLATHSSPTKPRRGQSTPSSSNAPLERYPLRVFMCAFMVLKHPEVVFSKQGEREESLVATATDMIAAFEVVLHRLVAPVSGDMSRSSSTGVSSEASEASGTEEGRAVTELLAAWDAAWVPYLEQFVAWKVNDAATLEGELIRMAAELESSMLSKTGPQGAEAPRVAQSDDLKAVVEQVRRDQNLLRVRIARLGGPSGTARLEAALNAAHAAAAANPTPPTTSPMTSPRRPGSASPAASPARDAVQTPPSQLQSGGAGDAMGMATASNEALMWELLYDLEWQMPMDELEALWTDALGETDAMTQDPNLPEGADPTEIATATHKRVRRIAERVLWDSVTADLTRTLSSPTADPQVSAPHILAALLSELGNEIADALPEQAARAANQLRNQLDLQGLQNSLASLQGTGLASLNLPQLMDALRSLSLALQALGSPAREGPARLAHASLQAGMADVVAIGDTAAFAQLVVKALALLRVQSRMLRLDLANVRLRMLANTLKNGAGTSYAKEKFLAAHKLTADTPPAELSTSLPLTRAWLALASGTLPSLEPGLTTPPSATSSAPSNNIPANLRSGLGSANNPTPRSALGAASQLQQGASSHSWRGLVRIGLVQLAAGDMPVAPHLVAETLAMDAGRLHAAQNSFQNSVVLATCLLLVLQARQGASRTPSEIPDMKRRLAALLADPSVRLPDLATELARMALSDPKSTPSEESVKRMESALNTMLVRSSAGFKAISNAICTALITRLLGGPSASIAPALARAGAGVLTQEVEKLAVRLGEAAAIGEAVHGDLYERLSTDLI